MHPNSPMPTEGFISLVFGSLFRTTAIKCINHSLILRKNRPNSVDATRFVGVPKDCHPLAAL
jgi:hypothetical protein